MKYRRFLSVVLAVLLFPCWPQVALSASTTTSAPSGTPANTTTKSASTTSGNTSTSVAEVIRSHPGSSYESTIYRLRPTDLISINNVTEPRATGDFRLGLDGSVQLPYLDPKSPLYLAGLTLDEVRLLISKAYVDQEILNKPTITVSVKEYSPRQLIILGDVGKPGPVPIPPEQQLTLVSAMALAGGPTPRASHLLSITRIGPDGKPIVLKDVDLRAAMQDGKKDIPVYEGDTINVTESLLGTDWQ